MKAKRTSKSKRARTERAKPRSVQRVVRAFEKNPKQTFWIPKLDGTGEYEPAKILRLTVITQPIESAFYVPGITNNQNIVEMDLDDLQLKCPNSDYANQSG